MELYLDSVNLSEIKAASELGYLTGLTTTPTFMVKEGVKDIDGQILEIAKYVNILQVEALGDNADEIVKEANRLLSLGLDKEKTVFKIPISLEGTKACKRLVNQGIMVNLHLVYTLQQAYMAFQAGATYVCPLVGRLQDQGHDALGLVRNCVEITEKYGYSSKVMFSSVRHAEHVKNALEIGVHTCTIPWKIMQKLTENHFTTIGTNQFIEDTRMLTQTVGDIMQTENVEVAADSKIVDALLVMSKSKLGAVIVRNSDGGIHRIFTDGDLRRLMEEHGDHAAEMKLSDLESNTPASVDLSASLYDAQQICKSKGVDTLVAMNGNGFAGLIDIQHLI